MAADPKKIAAETKTVSDNAFFRGVRVVKGLVTCKIVNWILFNTNLVMTLQIGDIPYKVVRLSPQPGGKVRIGLVGTNSVVADWYTKFNLYLGKDIQSYDEGLRPGVYFPLETVETETGELNSSI